MSIRKFKSVDGKIIEEEQNNRRVIWKKEDGKFVKYVLIPYPKSKSRANRLSDVIGSIESVISDLESKVDDLEEKEESLNDSDIAEVDLTLSTLGTDELESLFEELDNWRSGLEGTNLENSERYSILEESTSNLQEAIDLFSDLNTEPKTIEEIQDAIVTLNSIISSLESVEFPSMY